jgi:hypothetical protein
MPLTKVGRKYFTPSGCSAWNGRCFSGAAADFKCDVGFIAFRTSGWYLRKATPFWIMRDWFEHVEDPGCAWNSPQAAGFRAQWSRIGFELFQTMTKDYFFNSTTMIFEATYDRAPADWFEPCNLPDVE